jgi:NAD(P)-dependent dehydrogenase (short-subunit alcohol dehydrogenase family)
MRLSGKVALITGAGRGQGAATAELFAREGASVVVADIDGAGAKATAETILSNGGTAVAVQADVSTSAGVDAMVGAAVASFGGLDALVNNAGVTLFKSVEDTTEADFDWVIGVDLKGVFLTCRAVIPLMRAAGGGSIVNISSTTAVKGIRNHAAYSAAKAGVMQLTRSLAMEVGRDGIRINCVCPGPIDTPMFQGVSDQHGSIPTLNPASIPLGRVGQPAEVGSVSLFLCSAEASFMTGATLMVDGGTSAGVV